MSLHSSFGINIDGRDFKVVVVRNLAQEIKLIRIADMITTAVIASATIDHGKGLILIHENDRGPIVGSLPIPQMRRDNDVKALVRNIITTLA